MSVELLEDDFQNQLDDLERLFTSLTNNEVATNEVDISSLQFKLTVKGSSNQKPQQHSKLNIFRLAEMDSEKEG